jgi:2-desacetyl-2-hydroxyethyl bacteriochlorophyllide A dehydrogenase
MKHHALVFRQANQPSLEELPLPEPEPKEVLVRTAYSGVSIGTESSIFSGVRTHNGTFPLVGGYMLSGTIERTGTEVTSMAPGERVIAFGSRLTPGINSIWGGHVSRAILAADSAIKVPEGVSMRDAAMFVLSGVALNAVSMVGISEQDTVLIQGQGLIGQLFGQWARLRGARVLAIEPNSQRASLSRKHVTPWVLNPETDDVATVLKEATGGKGASVVVEATGNKSLIGKAASLLTFHGKLVFLGWYPGEVSFCYHDLHANEVRAYFPMGGGDRCAHEAFLRALAAGQIVMGDNITHTVPWHDACEGYRKIIRRDPSVLGMVIDWSGS